MLNLWIQNPINRGLCSSILWWCQFFVTVKETKRKSLKVKIFLVQTFGELYYQSIFFPKQTLMSRFAARLLPKQKMYLSSWCWCWLLEPNLRMPFDHIKALCLVNGKPLHIFSSTITAHLEIFAYGMHKYAQIWAYAQWYVQLHTKGLHPKKV